MSSIPALTGAQAREVDRLTAERFQVPVIWLMEAAGWQVARQVRGRAAVLCGKGNNGGDGLAAARHLHRWGRLAAVACTDPEALRGPAAEQARALRALGVQVLDRPELGDAQVIVDALLGTGLSRPPEGRVARWIELVAGTDRRVVSVDVPSGLDADTGRAPGACVRADVTVTLGLPKVGLLVGDGPAYAGEVWVADIGIPFEAYAALGVEVPRHLFAMHDRVQLHALRA
ncbi:MAG TPA: NAD(P)H-hydrate epimerase [Candidatus Dormibacteraeota bacterium]|nr:NAD(P)H-hydrate epimerase [Candidatus Dormibacteraeota bacterium]